MQGRLLPKYMGRYQAHPVGTWQQEFVLAQSLGLDLIEFIFDYNDADSNPLMSAEGLAEIQALVEHTGIKVRSVCADYFMLAPLQGASLIELVQRQDVLKTLIRNCSTIGVTDVVLPLVDQSSIQNVQSRAEFVCAILPIVEIAQRYGINIALEADLSPVDFVELLHQLPESCVTVNYDIGNSASLGYDPSEELAAYGHRISDVHIKDRVLGGSSVILGTGNAQIDYVLKKLFELEYKGIFIMQAYRDDQGVDIFKKQLAWVTSKLENKGFAL